MENSKENQDDNVELVKQHDKQEQDDSVIEKIVSEYKDLKSLLVNESQNPLLIQIIDWCIRNEPFYMCDQKRFYLYYPILHNCPIEMLNRLIDNFNIILLPYIHIAGAVEANRLDVLQWLYNAKKVSLPCYIYEVAATNNNSSIIPLLDWIYDTDCIDDLELDKEVNVYFEAIKVKNNHQVLNWFYTHNFPLSDYIEDNDVGDASSVIYSDDEDDNWKLSFEAIIYGCIDNVKWLHEHGHRFDRRAILQATWSGEYGMAEYFVNVCNITFTNTMRKAVLRNEGVVGHRWLDKNGWLPLE